MAGGVRSVVEQVRFIGGANHVHRQTLFIHQSSFPFSCIFCIYSIPLYAKISKETFLICTESFAT